MSSKRGLEALTAFALFVAVGAGGLIWASGCNISPIAVLAFVGGSTVQPGPPGGVTPPGGNEDFPSVCDLPANQQTINVTLRNESRAQVEYAIVFITTAGTGGFVCNDQRDTYLDFGYEVETLTAQNTKAFGCDNVLLDSGTELLAARITGTLPARVVGEEVPVADAPLDGSTAVPLPTVILLGDDASPSLFHCTTVSSCVSTSDICAQGGFVYVAGSICRATSLRTQGTLCNARVSSRPRWVLRNPDLIDRLARDFEYLKGGNIIITVLDRAASTDARQNQVVWQVEDEDGVVIHEEVR